MRSHEELQHICVEVTKLFKVHNLETFEVIAVLGALQLTYTHTTIKDVKEG